MGERGQAGIWPGRRKFLAASVSAVSTGLAACRPEPATVTRTTATTAGFPVTLDLEGGLFRQQNGAVEVAYPRVTGDLLDCPHKVPEHSMWLDVEGAVITVAGLPRGTSWDLKDYKVTFAVGGSTVKPGVWRPVPPKAHPDPSSPTERAWLDWVPTIDGKANDWDTRAATRLVLPTGDWSARNTKEFDFRDEIWSLVELGTTNEVRRQYLTDRVTWADRAQDSVVLTFEKGGAMVGSITLRPDASNLGVRLTVWTHGIGGDVQINDLVEHYCMYYSLLTAVQKKFLPRRLGEKFPGMTAPGFTGKTPGRFCPGGKILG